jgi:hypothetical protein
MSRIDERDLILRLARRAQIFLAGNIAVLMALLVVPIVTGMYEPRAAHQPEAQRRRADLQGRAADANAGRPRVTTDVGDVFTWAAIAIFVVSLPLSIYLPRRFVGNSRQRITARTFGGLFPGGVRDGLFGRGALQSDTGKLAYVWWVQTVLGGLFIFAPALFATCVYNMTNSPIALGMAVLLPCGLLARFPTRTRIANWIEGQQAMLIQDRPAAVGESAQARVGKSRKGSGTGHQTGEGSTRDEDEAYRWVAGAPGAMDQDRGQPLVAEDRESAGSWFGTMTSGEPTRSRVRERSHQPGSNYLGVFAVFFLLGCASLVTFILGSVVPDWRVFNRYRPNSCIVLEKRVASADDPGKVATYYPEIKIRYQVDGRNYEVWAYEAVSTLRKRPAAQAIVDSFQVKGTYPCWYDPDRPEHAVLVRGHSWTHYVFLLVPIPFVLIGGTGLYSLWKNRPKAPR